MILSKQEFTDLALLAAALCSKTVISINRDEEAAKNQMHRLEKLTAVFGKPVVFHTRDNLVANFRLPEKRKRPRPQILIDDFVVEDEP